MKSDLIRENLVEKLGDIKESLYICSRKDMKMYIIN
jgi:hypothetical protein